MPESLLQVDSKTNFSLKAEAFVLNTSPCINCFHFKTRVIKSGDVKHTIFITYRPLQKKLFEEGQVKIWYCKKAQLPRHVYIRRQLVFNLCNPDCQERLE